MGKAQKSKLPILNLNGGTHFMDNIIWLVYKNEQSELIGLIIIFFLFSKGGNEGLAVRFFVFFYF